MLRARLHPVGGSLLRPLLAPRVPGTPGALAAREHIVSTLTNAGFEVEVRPFNAETPLGVVEMANIIARHGQLTSKPELTLAAHYDSKRLPDGFVGAIDSAFPCALLLWLAQQAQKRTPKRSFELIFFDGEEAFVEWTDEDSLYGARALAPALAAEDRLPSTLVLLDLLGNKPEYRIPSWFKQTARLHAELAAIDPTLIGGELHAYGGMMLDDHIPFLQLGVPCLHLMPPRFPQEWHTLGDDGDLLDWPTMEKWARLMQKWLI